MKRSLPILLTLAGLATRAGAGDVIYVTPEDGKIHAADGSPLVIRGFNQIHWYGDQARNFDAIQDVSETGANTVRVVFGPPLYGITPPDPEAVVRKYILEEDVNVIVEDHGASCSQDPVALSEAVDRWLAPANVRWLTDPGLRGRIILNIANEWSGEANYVASYKDAIARLRQAGIKVPLMIDANGCGQNIWSIYLNWQELTQFDPEHNLIFGIHMYYWATDGRPDHFDVRTEMDRAVAMHIPLVVGEFSYNNGNNAVHYDTKAAMRIFNDRNIGWVAWSWNGNGPETGLNVIADNGWRLSQGLTPFGELLINDPEVGMKARALLGGLGLGGPLLGGPPGLPRRAGPAPAGRSPRGRP